MTHIAIRCNECRDERGRAKIFRQTCTECADSFIERHAVDFPSHVLESSWWCPDVPVGPDRRTNQLTRRAASGW